MESNTGTESPGGVPPGTPGTPGPTAPATLIPLSPYLDTLSLLCLMVFLPDWAGCVVLLGSILLGSSRVILGRCLTLLFGNLIMASSHHPHHSTGNGTGTGTSTGNGTGTATGATAVSLVAPVMTSLLLDVSILFVALAVQNQVLQFVKIAAYASIASALATSRTKTRTNSFLSAASLILVYLVFNFALNSFDLPNYAQTPFTQSSLTINYIHYLRKSWRFTLKFAIEFVNALLAIHICILNSPLSTVFPFTSYAIPLVELSSSIQAPNTVNGQPSARSEAEVLSIRASEDAANSSCPTLYKSRDLSTDDVPASYPRDQLSNIQDISSSSAVVNQNFENYFVLPMANKKSLKKKASVRFSQPLWSLIVAVKAMALTPDIYSGEDRSTALVQYSRLPAKEISCFVFMVSETEIGLELIGSQPSNEIVVKINGVVWYQTDTVIFKESTLYVKISMLTPLSEYHVEVLNDDGNDQRSLLADLIVSTTSNNPTLQQPIRSSPLITLQQSLQTTLDNMSREKLNLKKLKKEHQKRLATYNKDIAIRKKKLDNDRDERNHRKIMSLRTTVTSYEQEHSNLRDEIAAKLAEESEIHERYLDNKRIYDLRFRELDKIEQDYNAEKSVYTKQIESLDAELVNLRSKNDRLTKKCGKIVEDLNQIQSELQGLFDRDIARRNTILATAQKQRSENLSQMLLESSKLIKLIDSATADNDMARKQANY